MHSLNQVLFGFMLGIFSCVIYVYWMETIITNWCLLIFSEKRKLFNFTVTTVSMFIFFLIEYLIAFVPDYNTSEYVHQIQKINCGHVHEYKSFQFSAFKDCGYFAAAFGILYAFLIMKNPQHLALRPSYDYISLKNLLRVVIGLVFCGLPMWIFRTNLWKNL